MKQIELMFYINFKKLVYIKVYIYISKLYHFNINNIYNNNYIKL